MRKTLNENITSREVVLIDNSGNNLGVLLTREALQKSSDLGLDLVQVSNNPGSTPVCKIMDYGKELYKEKKNNKKNQSQIVKLKEVRFRTTISEHDKQTKIRHVEKFLKKGHSVKISLQVYGRDRENPVKVSAALEDFLDDVDFEFQFEKEPKLSGHFYSAIIKPL